MKSRYAPQTEHYRELLAACRAELVTLGYGAATVSLNGVGELLAWLEERGRLRLDTVDQTDMEGFLAHLHVRPSRRGGVLSAGTVTAYLARIGLLFDYAERHGMRGGSPLVGLARPRAAGAERYVASREEVARLYVAAESDARMTALLHLLYGCGLRRTEAERLNVDDVDYAGELLYVRQGKGRKRRVIPLTPRVAAGLRDYRRRHRWRWVATTKPSPALLLNDRGGRLRGQTIAKRLRKLVARAEVDERITPHVLRHALATHLLAGGMALERIRDLLGHDYLQTTQLYTHVKPATA